MKRFNGLSLCWGEPLARLSCASALLRFFVSSLLRLFAQAPLGAGCSLQSAPGSALASGERRWSVEGPQPHSVTRGDAKLHLHWHHLHLQSCTCTVPAPYLPWHHMHLPFRPASPERACLHYKAAALKLPPDPHPSSRRYATIGSVCQCARPCVLPTPPTGGRLCFCSRQALAASSLAWLPLCIAKSMRCLASHSLHDSRCLTGVPFELLQ